MLDENKPAMARARLGRVLREGLAEWDRAQAFGMAGEIALRLGSATRAVAWYRQAVSLPDEPPAPEVRLGFAVALLRAGRKADATREVQVLLTDECETTGGEATVIR